MMFLYALAIVSLLIGTAALYMAMIRAFPIAFSDEYWFSWKLFKNAFLVQQDILNNFLK